MPTHLAGDELDCIFWISQWDVTLTHAIRLYYTGQDLWTQDFSDLENAFRYIIIDNLI